MTLYDERIRAGELFDEGFMHKEIAVMLNVHKDTVGRWIREDRTNSNKNRTKSRWFLCKHHERKESVRLFDEGWSRRRIAKELGVHVQTVGRWIKEERPNDYRFRKQRQRLKALELYNEGYTLREIQDVVHVSLSTLSLWIRNEGIKRKSKKELFQDQAYEMYVEGVGFAEIADALGVCEMSIRGWINEDNRPKLPRVLETELRFFEPDRNELVVLGKQYDRLLRAGLRPSFEFDYNIL
ncbi:MAG: helix-turn-helix domain-containing protein [Methanobrevibacter sp.]|jgi:uncharacterized protein YjcR|nr:helix-turn-helix domain-containing protein [Candidatus Methanovirga australis]